MICVQSLREGWKLPSLLVSSDHPYDVYSELYDNFMFKAKANMQKCERIRCIWNGPWMHEKPPRNHNWTRMWRAKYRLLHPNPSPNSARLWWCPVPRLWTNRNRLIRDDLSSPVTKDFITSNQADGTVEIINALSDSHVHKCGLGGTLRILAPNTKEWKPWRSFVFELFYIEYT